ncbi:MAG TPA: hypothetical protein VK590_11305, partial [Saprospiraceae bacterium]|nr:hypothetical protein [Saprospiraceae bacterium]
MLKLLLFIFLFPIILNGQTNPDWNTFNTLNYSILYPSHWQSDTSDEKHSIVLFYSPLESPTDQFEENVNILFQDLSATNLNLKTFAELSESQIKTMVTNSNILESKQLTNGKKPYHKIIYIGDFGI